MTEWWHGPFKLLGLVAMWMLQCLPEMLGLRSGVMVGLLLGVHTEEEVLEAEAEIGVTVALVVGIGIEVCHEAE